MLPFEVLFFLGALIISTILFHLAASSLSFEKINPISAFYYYVLMFFIVGAFLRLMGIYSIKMTIEGCPLSQKEMRCLSLFIGGWFSCVGLMFLGLSRLFPAGRAYRLGNVDYARGGAGFSIIGAAFLCLIVFFSILYTGIVFGGYPVMDLIGGNGFESRLSRVNFKRGFEGIDYIKNLLAETGAVIAAGMSLVLFLTREKTFKTWALLVISWALFFFVSIWSVEKSPIIWLITYYVVLLVLLGKPLSMIKVAMYGMLGVFLLSVMYFLVMYNSDLDRLLSIGVPVMLDRVFLSQGDGIYYAYSLWPDSIPFLGASGTSNLIARVFGEEYMNPMRYMMEMLTPSAIRLGTGGVKSTLFIGQAYAVGGIAFVIISTFITVSMIYFLYYIFTTKCRKTPLNVAIYAYFIVYYTKSLGSGFFTNVIVNWVYLFFALMVLSRELIVSSILRQKGHVRGNFSETSI
jgi:hypothetical protein